MKRTELDDKIVYEFLKEAPGDEDAGDEPVEDTEAEDTGEDTGDEEIEWEEGEEDTADEDDSEEEPTIDNTSLLDAEIDAVLIDFESKARFEQESEVQEEGFLYESGISILLEEEDSSPVIDTEVFAAEVARLIKNYDNLLDMEAL